MMVHIHRMAERGLCVATALHTGLNTVWQVSVTVVGLGIEREARLCARVCACVECMVPNSAQLVEIQKRLLVPVA